MDINTVCLSGRLAQDPEARQAGSQSVTELNLAVNGRKKEGEEWVDVPNFFRVSVWGAPGEWCVERLSKGSPVTVSGRLQWRSWEDGEGNKRSAVDVVAHDVVLPPRDGGAVAAPDTSGEPDW